MRKRLCRSLGVTHRSQCPSLILMSFVLCPHAAGQRVPKGFVEQHIGAEGTCFYLVSTKETRL
jgi:hypothetical protein